MQQYSIQEQIQSLPDIAGRSPVAKRMLRPIDAIQGATFFIDSLRTNLL